MLEARRAKKIPPGFSTRHISPDHRLPMRFVAGKVKHGATQHDIETSVGKRHLLDRFDAKVIFSQMRRQRRRQPARLHNRTDRVIYGEDFEAAAKQIDQIASSATPRVEHAHSRRNASLQKLIEQINVDAAEPLL